MKKEQKEKICAYCGKVFVQVARAHTKFCSKQCKNNYIKEKYTYERTFTCYHCGKVFTKITRNNLTRYCSKECAKASRVRINPDQNHPVFGNIQISKEFQDYLMTEILVLDFVDFKNIFELGKDLYFRQKLCAESNC